MKLGDGKTNLLVETRCSLADHKKKPNDVLWVGNGKVYITWEEFAEAVCDYDYVAGFGAEVAVDLVVVGYNWWLERPSKYDRAEGWVYKTLPERPASKGMPKITGRLICCLIQGIESKPATDVEVIDEPLTQQEIDKNFKDAGICKFGEVKQDG